MAELSDYEKEQAALASKLDGGGGDDLHIEMPQDPEVNPEVYRDVEPLIFRGFLTVSAEINGVHFVFKSLNQHEMELLKFLYPTGRTGTKFWSDFLAYGVFMVDGVNVLPERDKFLGKISATFSELPNDIRSKVIWHLSEVNRRAANAVTLTECYVLEKYSRYRWYQLHGLDLTSTSVTGIQGTSTLGLNWGQLIWRAVNRIEDMNMVQEQEWEHAKFVGSCMAGKGITRVYQQDNDRRKREKEEEIARKDRIIRKVLLGEDTSLGTQTAGAVKIVARTVEELTAQLERDLRGEKDFHDLVVEQYENRLREGYNRRQAQLEDLARVRDEEFGGKELLGGSDMTGMTLEQVQKHMAERNSRKGSTEQQWPELYDEKLRGTVNRYIVGNEDPPAPSTATYPIAPIRRNPSQR